MCIAFVLIGFFFSCKTIKPPHEQINLESVLTFENIEAENPENVFLDFKLDVYNTDVNNAELLFPNPELLINGNPAESTVFSFEFLPNERLTKQERKIIPVRLIFHASEYEKIVQNDFDEYEFVFTIPVHYVFPTKTMETFAKASISFPRVREPDFKISMIRIMQAELINTQLKVSLHIDNPNYFPIELTSFHYELYGDNRFWAKGEEQNILKVPAKESAEFDLFLTMNFTNMRRNVLDQVIAMTGVRYRLTGNATIETGIALLPSFIMNHNLEGYSEVVR